MTPKYNVGDTVKLTKQINDAVMTFDAGSVGKIVSYNEDTPEAYEGANYDTCWPYELLMGDCYVLPVSEDEITNV